MLVFLGVGALSHPGIVGNGHRPEGWSMDLHQLHLKCTVVPMLYRIDTIFLHVKILQRVWCAEWSLEGKMA